MALSVTCACGLYFEPSEAYAGRRAQCPGCGRVFTLPEAATPADVAG